MAVSRMFNIIGKHLCNCRILRKKFRFIILSDFVTETNEHMWFGSRHFSATSVGDYEDITKIRNIGIIAHIDAGKTTTTERMLYYSGSSEYLGDVDRGNTVMDFMDQERERGITVNSAAITFHWNHHKINLIDTPGHIDFTMEVERALRVLDGSVTIIDASAGVETQTLTVWQQAQNYNIPSIVYLNKMDKKGASLQYCLKSLQDKLKLTPLLLQLPVGAGNDLKGIVDLIHFKTVTWDHSQSCDGKSYVIKSLREADNSDLYTKALLARNNLIGQLADHDEQLADLVLETEKLENIYVNSLESAVRRITLARLMVPVLCGSSLKNKGVQPLMDSITSYLPSPQDISYNFVDYYGVDLCALAFKVSHDSHRGPLTYIRIYSGSLKNGTTLYNVNQQTMEKASRILQVYADEFHDISTAVAGNIVAVAGFKKTFTGDTLLSSQFTSKNAARAWQRDQQPKKGRKCLEDELEESVSALAGVKVPTPVFFCSIEPASVAYQKDLDHALECLQKEDPSLKVEVNAETGQTIVSGMGKLHLDIIHSRIHKEYGIETDLGPLQIAYRETITHHAEASENLERALGGKQHHVHLRMSVNPDANFHFKHVKVVSSPDNPMQRLNLDQLKALENGVKSALKNGAVLGFPIVNVDVSVHEFSIRPGTSLAMVAACAVQCVNQAVKQAGPQLLEPIMKLEIRTNEDHIHSVLQDLTQRRSQVSIIDSIHDMKLIEAVVPLAELTDYSTDLRIITSGTATFSMELSHYDKMTAEDQNRVVESVTGFVHN